MLHIFFLKMLLHSCEGFSLTIDEFRCELSGYSYE